MPGVGRLAGYDLEENSSQQVHVAGRTDGLERPGRHLGRHVGGRPSHAARLADLVGFDETGRRQCDPPVHHQHFAEVAEHDVFRLQIAVDDAARVGKGHRVGDVHQDVEVLGERLGEDDVRPGCPSHTLHGIEELAPRRPNPIRRSARCSG